MMILGATTVLPGIFQKLAPVLNHDGYLAVFGLVLLEDFGVPVPGETVLIAAAVYAGAGRLNPVAVGLIALCAAVLGDNIGFGIGHFLGRAAVLRWGRYVFLNEERLAKAEGFMNRHGGWIIIIARFIEGLRQANGIVAGISEMRWTRFLMFNAIGAALWVGLWLTLGDAAGGHIGAIYSAITRFSLYFLIAAAILVIALVARSIRRRRRRRQAPTAKD